MDRPIAGFPLDAHDDRVAELDCGHFQHVRHDPPWTNRAWTRTPEGRASALGQVLPCRQYHQRPPADKT